MAEAAGLLCHLVLERVDERLATAPFPETADLRAKTLSDHAIHSPNEQQCRRRSLNVAQVIWSQQERYCRDGPCVTAASMTSVESPASVNFH